MLKRRDLIKLAGAGGAALALPVERFGAAGNGRVAAPAPFSVPLHTPPVARPVHRDATTDYYYVGMREAEVEIFPGVRTKVQTYGGEFPGPTIRATRGRRVAVTQYNGLPDPTVVHLHGAHLSHHADGYPMDVIPPGTERDYVYPNTQSAATLWYHDHAHHTSAEHVYRGLAGTYLLSDPAEDGLGLPRGQYDVPIMLRDAAFDDAGQLTYTPNDFEHRTTLLINGRTQPYFRVAARKYRLRFLNSANERAFDLSLSNGMKFHLVGSDGGLLPAPVTVTNFPLWPGERVEAVVDFSGLSAGTQVVLTNSLGESDATKPVMRFDVVGTAVDSDPMPAALRPRPDLGEATVQRHVEFRLDLNSGMYLIDGKPFDPNRIDQHIKNNTTEIWTITNTDTRPSIPHNMHLHLVQFQVLDRNGGAVGGHETGSKDTVTVPPGGNVRIKVRFSEHTGLFVYHCHLLDHAAMGMMAQMQITE